MNLKSLLLALLCIPLVTVNQSCSEDCQNALADLVTEVVLTGTASVLAGTPFSIPSLVGNVLNTVEECSGDLLGTETAAASESMLSIDYDSNQDGSFDESVLNNNFDVPPIPAGQEAEQEYTFEFNEPGEYRLITFADVGDDVDERDESNNLSDPEDLTTRFAGNGSSRALIIRVLPNPDYERPASAPFVEVLGYTVEVN